ncbi:uncharacterized protein LOC106666051 [Cimex lectularius]|uniref:Brain protein I3 n=1 Tax=Cimex lectularius TaxID=79782 RepID=A0A8I6TKI3_CIMLE|nr:uncharacterized protein LOC106666051 [Cimex lectularius]
METEGDEGGLNSHDTNNTTRESQPKGGSGHATRESKNETHANSSPTDNFNENANINVQPVLTRSNSTMEPYNDSQYNASLLENIFENANRDVPQLKSDSSKESNDDQTSTSPPSENSRSEVSNDWARNRSILERFLNPPSKGYVEEPQPIVIIKSNYKRQGYSAQHSPIKIPEAKKNFGFNRNPFLRYNNKYFNSPPLEDRIPVGRYQRTSIPEGPPGYVPCVMPKMPPPSYGAVSSGENEVRPGMCPACKIGLLKEEYSYATLFCFCCYPFSCGRYKKCENCGAYFQ